MEKDRWQISSTIDVPDLRLSPSPGFWEVLVGRRTIRTCEPMGLKDVLSIIQFTMKSVQRGVGENRGRLRKTSISAGAMHPLEVLVVGGPEVSDPIVYCDATNNFGTVPLRSITKAKNELGTLADFLPQARGHLLLFVANQRHIEQAYSESRTLIWRDAGAVMQTLSLTAAALNRAFVPLGSSGGALLDAIVTPAPRLCRCRDCTHWQSSSSRCLLSVAPSEVGPIRRIKSHIRASTRLAGSSIARQNSRNRSSSLK